MFKSRLSLELESRIRFETLLNNVEMFLQKCHYFGYDSCLSDNFLNTHLSDLIGLNIIQQSLSLFFDKISIHIANWSDVIRLLLVESVKQFEVHKIFVNNKKFEATLLSQQSLLRLDKHLTPKCLQNILLNFPIEYELGSPLLHCIILAGFLQVVDKIHVADNVIGFSVIEYLSFFDKILV